MGEKKFFGGNRIGIVDIAFGINIAHWLGVLEEEALFVVAYAMHETHLQNDDNRK